MKARSSGFTGAAVLSLVLVAVAAAGEPVAREESSTRPPALAGTWYPGGRSSLLAAADFLMRLGAEAPTPAGRPVALVVPHAGWNHSGLAAATAYRLLRPGEFGRVVVVAPSHRGGFPGYALADVSAYETPLGPVPVCPGSTTELEGKEARPVAGVAGSEHSIEVELPFLQVALGQFCLVPVLVGETGPDLERAFAERLARLDDGRTLFVFSSDFLHYGPRYDFTPYGALSPATLGWIREQDRRAIEDIERVDAPAFRSFRERTHATICGSGGLLTLLHLIPRIAKGARATLLAHYLSADLPSAQDDASVSYVTLAFTRPPSPARPETATARPPAAPPLTTLPFLDAANAETPPLDAETGARLLRLARAALTTELRGTSDLERELLDWPRGREHLVRQGVFVSLYRKPATGERGTLRGCVGQREPVLPLYYGTVQAALDAALHDPRFPAVTASELERLEVEVSVLWPRRPVSSWRDIRLGTDGIVLEKDDRSALLLPRATTVFGSIEDALSALAGKAGLPPDGWRDARLFVFSAQVFSENQASR